MGARNIIRFHPPETSAKRAFELLLPPKKLWRRWSAAHFDDDERWGGAELSAELDRKLRRVAFAADLLPGYEVPFVSPYDRSRVGGLDSRFAGKSLCEVAVKNQLYRGFDAFIPVPGSTPDPALENAVLYGNRPNYTLLAEMVLTEVPSGFALN